MKYIYSLFLFFAFSSIKAQKTISIDRVNEHIGDSVTLWGDIKGIRYLQNTKGAPTLINIGAPYPNQILTVVIYGDNRKNFPEAPEVMFKDQLVTITGVVELFKGKPQIVVSSPSNLQIIKPIEKQPNE